MSGISTPPPEDRTDRESSAGSVSVRVRRRPLGYCTGGEPVVVGATCQSTAVARQSDASSGGAPP